MRVVARSPLYETDAVSARAAAALPERGGARRDVAAGATRCWRLCLAVEAALGRVRPPGRHAAPRVIDIDLLLYGDAVIDRPASLIVPHPRMLERPFVRIPLADVALPGLVHPVTGEALDSATPGCASRSGAQVRSAA